MSSLSSRLTVLTSLSLLHCPQDRRLCSGFQCNTSITYVSPAVTGVPQSLFAYCIGYSWNAA